MDHKAFRQLLKRYLDNSCTDDEKKIIDQWYELLDNENADINERDLVATVQHAAEFSRRDLRNVWFRRW